MGPLGDGTSRNGFIGVVQAEMVYFIGMVQAEMVHWDGASRNGSPVWYKHGWF